MQCFHPSEFIQDELDARGWTRLDLAKRMSGDVVRNQFVLDLYLEVGGQNPGMRMGEDVARQLGFAFGTSYQLWLNLERAWLAAR